MLLHLKSPLDHLSVNTLRLLLQSVISFEFNADVLMSGSGFSDLFFTAAVCFESLNGLEVVASNDQEQNKTLESETQHLKIYA